MFRTTKTAAIVVATAMSLIAGCGQPTEPENPRLPDHGQEPAYATDLRTAINKTMKDNAIPGAVVLIRSREKGDWTATFGTSVVGEDKAMAENGHFRVGSITKTMTSTVLLQLVQEGKLSLDDPISKYREGVPNGDNITLRQLSEMRSGIHSYTFDLGFSETLDKDPQKVWTPDELLDIAFSHPNDFAPGTQYEYSNTNIILLGVVIEKVTGKKVAELFSERIFEPLKLENTSFPEANDSSIPDPHSQGYSFGTVVSTLETAALSEPQLSEALNGTLKPNDVTDANPSWAWTAGGAISTVEDLATYVEALVGGGLLDEQMQKERLDSIQQIDPRAGYGLGIGEFGGTLIGHDGQIPGYMTFAGYDPKTELTIVIGTNLASVPTGMGSALVVLETIAPAFYGPNWAQSDPAQQGASTSVTPTR